MIVVTAATGNIGQSLVGFLLKKNKKVLALGRNAEKLKGLEKQGAETRLVDLTDGVATAKAFQGAEAVFTLIPPRYNAPDFKAYYGQVSRVYGEALRGAGVSHVVNLSSVGAHLPDNSGVIRGLHAHELELNKLDKTHVLHLRPGYFMENFFFSLGLIKTQGINGSPLRPDVKIPMIATRDIAQVAADQLIARDFSGKSARYLLGQRDLTLAEATRILGQAIGKPDLPYIQFPEEDAFKAMVGMGMSADVAALFNEMYRGFNEGRIVPTRPRDAASTTPTAIETFATTFAAVYQKS
jgi:uncharacterized protein YbjT (DUF2867 family)